MFLISLPLILSLSGCWLFRPLLYDVRIHPQTISPNADGHDDVALIEYKLGRNATVSIYFVDQNGQRYYFRRERPRAKSISKGYSVYFGGVINISSGRWPKARMLPDGEYTFVIEATDGRGRSYKVEQPFTIVDADTTYPELRGFSVHPPVFTPNRDGVGDRVTVNYYLTKEADVQVYLIGEDGVKYPLEERPGPVKPGKPGPHVCDYEGGVDLGAEPPPDGTYTVVVTAEDKVGAKETVTGTLTIMHGGVPLAAIVNGEVFYSVDGTDVEFPVLTMPLGATLYFTATVENYGDTPIRTTGPPPGTVYTTRQNYSTLGWHQSDGAMRLGINFEENPGLDYPFRWGLGRPEELTKIGDWYYLMPGQQVVITGALQILDEPLRNPFYLWAGLIHDGVEVVQNQLDPIHITVDVAAQGAWNKNK